MERISEVLRRVGAQMSRHCVHPKAGRKFFKFTTRIATHIVERCGECMWNVNGPGVWLSRFKAKIENPETLPEDPIHGATEPAIPKTQTGFKF